MTSSKSVAPGDLLLLKFILHAWNEDQAITILRNCRKALTPGGRIAVIEMVVGVENPLAAIFDMNMFIMSAGRERSIEEFDALFAAAGLKRIAMHRTASPQVVIEVGPAEAGNRLQVGIQMCCTPAYDSVASGDITCRPNETRSRREGVS